MQIFLSNLHTFSVTLLIFQTAATGTGGVAPDCDVWS